MVLDKLNKCKLCDWKGKTHFHHIIPKSEFGMDCPDNLIEICPNHHAEANEDEHLFAKKHKLTGLSYSEEQIKELREYGHIFVGLVWGDEIPLQRLLEAVEIEKKYNLDKKDAVAISMGLTRSSVERYVTSSIPKEDQKLQFLVEKLKITLKDKHKEDSLRGE